MPIGSKNQVILDTDNFERTSKVLRNVTFSCADFEEIIERTRPDDFLFLDPPYTVKHDNNGFVKYNERIFSWADQVRLREAVERASARAVKIMMLNANHSSIEALYKGFGSVLSVQRKSVISGSNAGRGLATELVIRNYLDE